MRMRASLVLLPLLFGALFASATTGFLLISPAEYRSEARAQQRPGASLAARAADLNAPTITVVSPGSTAIKPPVDIDLRFTAAPGATVNPASLKVLYGFLKLDVTQRIIGAPGVQVSPSGLKAAGAQLPPGSYKLVVEVADNLGRTGVQPLAFTVER